MTCPDCGGKTKVQDTVADCDAVYRKRICVECLRIIYTTESESTPSDIDTMSELKASYYRRAKGVKRQYAPRNKLTHSTVLYKKFMTDQEKKHGSKN